MNDCQSAMMRDQLPDLLHDRLSAGARAAVLAHVDGCAECRDELALLRGVHQAMILRTPRVDTARIVAALPKPGASVVVPVVPIRPARSRWADWRIAATITVLAGGATSAAVLIRSRPNVMPVDTVAVSTHAPGSFGPETTTARAITPAAGSATPAAAVRAESGGAVPVVAELPDSVTSNDVETDARLKRLDNRQLRALLNEIEQFKAVPITEPEPVVINVNARATSGASDGMELR